MSPAPELTRSPITGAYNGEARPNLNEYHDILSKEALLVALRSARVLDIVDDTFQITFVTYVNELDEPAHRQLEDAIVRVVEKEPGSQVGLARASADGQHMLLTLTPEIHAQYGYTLSEVVKRLQHETRLRNNSPTDSKMEELLGRHVPTAVTHPDTPPNPPTELKWNVEPRFYQQANIPLPDFDNWPTLADPAQLGDIVQQAGTLYIGSPMRDTVASLNRLDFDSRLKLTDEILRAIKNEPKTALRVSPNGREIGVSFNQAQGDAQNLQLREIVTLLTDVSQTRQTKNSVSGPDTWNYPREALMLIQDTDDYRRLDLGQDLTRTMRLAARFRVKNGNKVLEANLEPLDDKACDELSAAVRKAVEHDRYTPDRQNQVRVSTDGRSVRVDFSEKGYAEEGRELITLYGRLYWKANPIDLLTQAGMIRHGAPGNLQSSFPQSDRPESQVYGHLNFGNLRSFTTDQEFDRVLAQANELGISDARLTRLIDIRGLDDQSNVQLNAAVHRVLKEAKKSASMVSEDGKTVHLFLTDRGFRQYAQQLEWVAQRLRGETIARRSPTTKNPAAEFLAQTSPEEETESPALTPTTPPSEENKSNTPPGATEPSGFGSGLPGSGGRFGPDTPPGPSLNDYKPVNENEELAGIIEKAQTLTVRSPDNLLEIAELRRLDNEARKLLTQAILRSIEGDPYPVAMSKISPDGKDLHIAFNQESWNKYGRLLSGVVKRLQMETKLREESQQNLMMEELLGRAASEATAHFPNGMPYKKSSNLLVPVYNDVVLDGKKWKLHASGMQYAPVSKGTKVEAKVDAISQAVADASLLVLVINRDKWDRIVLESPAQGPIDKQARDDFAKLLIEAVESDPDVSGNRFESHPEMLYVFFSEKGYVENGSPLKKAFNERLLESQQRESGRSTQNTPEGSLAQAPMLNDGSKTRQGAKPEAESQPTTAYYPDGTPYNKKTAMASWGYNVVKIDGKPHGLPARPASGFLYKPGSEGKKVEPNTAAVSEALADVSLLAMVINRDKWDQVLLESPFASDRILDQEARDKLAAAIVKAIEQDPGVEGNRLETHPESLYVFFSEKGFMESGVYFNRVVDQLHRDTRNRSEADARRQAEQAAKRAQELLGGSSEQKPQEAESSSSDRGSRGRNTASSVVESTPGWGGSQANPIHYPDGTRRKFMSAAFGQQYQGKGTNYKPVSKGTKVELNAPAIVEALSAFNANMLVLVIDRDQWQYVKSPLVDATAKEEFAQVILHALSQDKEVEGNRLETHPDGLHIFFSENGYEKFGRHFYAVMERLQNDADARTDALNAKRQVEQKLRVEQMLRAVKGEGQDQGKESASYSLQGQDGFPYRLVLKENGVGKVQYQVEPVQEDNGNPLYVGQTFTGLTPFQAKTPGENVKVNTEAIAGALDSTNVLRIVVDQEQWMIVLVSWFADAQTHQQLATALVAAIEKDPSYDGNRVTLYPGMLEIHFSKEGYNQYGQHLGQVASKISETMAQSSIFKAAIRSNELLGAAQKAKSGDKAQAIEVDAKSIVTALKSARMLRIHTDTPERFQRFPLTNLDEQANLVLARYLQKKVEDNPYPQGEQIKLHPDELYVHLSPRDFEEVRQAFPIVLYNLTAEAMERKTGNTYPKMTTPPQTTNPWSQIYPPAYGGSQSSNNYQPRYESPTAAILRAQGFAPVDSSLYQDEARAFQLAGKLRNFQGSDEEKEKLVTELKDTLQKAFDVRLGNQRKQLEEAEAKLKKSRALLDKRQENADTIIQRRLDELTGNQEMQWNVPGTYRPSPAPARGYLPTPANQGWGTGPSPAPVGYPPAYDSSQVPAPTYAPVPAGQPASYVPNFTAPASVVSPSSPSNTMAPKKNPKLTDAAKFVPQQSPPSKKP
ncbi:hypothetical protein C5Y93_15380 [Blastopirellula marina]|uniref:Uncharacterized protein n=2 Tax=Blastopirellula marina TaxID=124 RepID=A0A2S8GLL6_9BACT|nr:hypothetical protein C5Y93_15380 [Blastopirellula marina]